jgi:hypothetical protein
MVCLQFHAQGAATPGTFKTIVGCNDCPGGSENKAAFLQTWVDDGSVSILHVCPPQHTCLIAPRV